MKLVCCCVVAFSGLRTVSEKLAGQSKIVHGCRIHGWKCFIIQALRMPGFAAFAFHCIANCSLAGACSLYVLIERVSYQRWNASDANGYCAIFKRGKGRKNEYNIQINNVTIKVDEVRKPIISCWLWDTITVCFPLPFDTRKQWIVLLLSSSGIEIMRTRVESMHYESKSCFCWKSP